MVPLLVAVAALPVSSVPTPAEAVMLSPVTVAVLAVPPAPPAEAVLLSPVSVAVLLSAGC